MPTTTAEDVRAHLETFIRPEHERTDADEGISWEECRWSDGYEGPACQLCNQPLQLGDIHLARHADVAELSATRFPLCGECLRANAGDPDFVISTPVLPGQLPLVEA